MNAMENTKPILGHGVRADYSPANQAWIIRPYSARWNAKVQANAPVLRTLRSRAEADAYVNRNDRNVGASENPVDWYAKKYGPEYVVFIDHPAWPSTEGCLIGAIRIPPGKSFDDVRDQIPPTVMKMVVVRANTGTEAKRTAASAKGLHCPDHAGTRENPLTVGGKALIGAGIVGGVILAGIGVAYAYNKSQGTSPPPAPSDPNGWRIVLKMADNKKLITAYPGDQIILPALSYPTSKDTKWRAEGAWGVNQNATRSELEPLKIHTQVHSVNGYDTMYSWFEVTKPGAIEFAVWIERQGMPAVVGDVEMFSGGVAIAPGRRS